MQVMDSRWPEQEPEDLVQPLTREEARALTARHPSVSVGRVIAVQTLAGVLVALTWWLVSGSAAALASALYGAACVVVPGALFAYGLSRQVRGINAVLAMFGFALWEFVKISVAIIMLVAAAKVVPELNWPAFLVAMVVCIKMNWLALLLQTRKQTQTRTLTQTQM